MGGLPTEWIERTGHYSYRGRGRVIDQKEGLVGVLGFIVEMGAPCNGYVDFDIRRLDITTWEAAASSLLSAEHKK